MSEATPRVLVIGYGNPGRGDDGLGPAAAEAIGRLGLPGVRVDADYQLSVEDAAAVAEVDVVVFVDADLKGDGPFSFRPVEPVAEVGFSTHSVSAEAVLGMAHQLFGARTQGWVLGIRGYVFDPFVEQLGEPAERNLAAALTFLTDALRTRKFQACSGHEAATVHTTGR